MDEKRIDQLPVKGRIDDSDLLAVWDASDARSRTKSVTGKTVKSLCIETAKKAVATVYVGDGTNVPPQTNIKITTANAPSRAVLASVDNGILKLTTDRTADAAVRFKDQNTGKWVSVSQIGIPGNGIDHITSAREGLVTKYRIHYTGVDANGEDHFDFELKDGIGSVVKIDGKGPDGEGNVILTAKEIPYDETGKSIHQKIYEISPVRKIMTTAKCQLANGKSILPHGTVLFDPKVPEIDGYAPVAIIGYHYISASTYVQQLIPYRARLAVKSGSWYVDFAVKETTDNAFSANVEFSILYILEDELLRG